MTWSRRASYSDLHWVLSCAGVTFGWPLAGLGWSLVLEATQALKSGGCGIVAFAWPLDFAAMSIQWLKVDLVIGSPLTVATALPGTPPQPATRAARATARRATRESEVFVVMRTPQGSEALLCAA